MVTNQRRHAKAASVYFVVSLLVAANLAAAQSGGGTTIPYREWYTGDGLGVNIMLYLQDDDSYSATWDGCLGRYGSASGTWSQTGDIVDLVPDLEDGMLEGFLVRLHFMTTQQGPRLELLQQDENGEWIPRPAFDFRPVGASPQEESMKNDGMTPSGLDQAGRAARQRP